MGRMRGRCARRAGAPVARMCVSVRESALVWHVALTHITVGSARAPAAEGHGRVPFACHWRATSSFRRASARASAGAGGGAAAAAGGASRGEETECAVRRRCVARRPRACRQRPGLRATRPDGISAAPSQRVRATSPALGAAAPPHTRLCRGHRTQPARRAAPRLLLIPPPRSVEERHPMGSFWRMHPAPPRRERTRAPQTRGAPKTPRKSQRVCLGASPPPTRALFGCARCGRRHRVRDLGTLSPPPSDREGNPSRCCAPPAARPGRALVASLFSSPDGTRPPPLPPRARRAGHGQAAVAATARAAGRPLRVPQRLAARPQAQHRLRGGEVPKRGRYAARPPSEQHRRPSGPARHAEAGAAGGSKSHPPLIAT